MAWVSVDLPLKKTAFMDFTKQFFLVFLLLPIVANAQYVTGIGTKWSDDFTEWTIYTDGEEQEGELTMRWQMNGDWSQWDYRIGEETGSIETKWKNDFSQWEIRGGNEIITVRMVWPNDPREWRLTNNTITLTLKSRWSNSINEWRLKNDTYGIFDIYTEWENDPREWNIVDELDEDVSIHMKMALTFLSIFHSIPKR